MSMILIISNPNSYAAKRMGLEAKKLKLKVEILSVWALAEIDFKIDVTKYSVLYVRNPYLKERAKFLPEIIELAKKFKAEGKKVVDSIITEGFLARGKWEDYNLFKKAGLLIPVTKKLEPATENLTYPLVLKWIYGFKAKGVFLIKNSIEFKSTVRLHPTQEWLMQEFIEANYEYKVITVGYKALPVVIRFKIKDLGFRIEFGSPKVLDSLSIPEVVVLAEKASKALGRELAKVDILQKGDRFYILEVNRFPGLESFEKLTHYNVFKEFLEYLQT